MSKFPTAFWDIMPTLADLSGGKIEGKEIDGVSILPTLLKTGDQKDHDYLYWELDRKSVV